MIKAKKLLVLFIYMVEDGQSVLLVSFQNCPFTMLNVVVRPTFLSYVFENAMCLKARLTVSTFDQHSLNRS